VEFWIWRIATVGETCFHRDNVFDEAFDNGAQAGAVYIIGKRHLL